MKKTVQHIEAVIVSVGYADFLQATLPFNAGLIDRIIVVTEPQDEQTRWVCNRYNVECILSEDGKRHTRNGTGFNKGRLIERGMQHCSDEGWVLHMDADIALPHRFRHLLELADLQHDTIYGCDRFMVKSYEDWKRVKQSDFMNGGGWDFHCRTSFPPGFDIGTRWTHPQMGAVPIGFFQLAHSSQIEWRGIRSKPYPANHSSACRTDIQWALKWDRHKRANISEVIVAHLESDDVAKGANWKGRSTKWFGPAIPVGPRYGFNGS